MSDVSSGALQLLTLPEAAQRLGVCRRSLERLIAAGEFPRPLKVRGSSRVPSSDVATYVARLLAQRGAA
ncbi:MAG TPA: helix-turn-helix domain-containing protein [Lacunisphaera sp.]|nr:helix-turn-helix domain-containing protein [Lacunisphaera sp.]